METIDIYSGLENFNLLSEITAIRPDQISGSASFQKAPPYLGIEACAQLCAMHVRYLCRFIYHVFLLNIDNLKLSDQKRLEGTWAIQAKRRSYAQSAFAYTFCSTGPQGDQMAGNLIIAQTPYDETFREEALKPFFEERFRCLRHESRNG